MKSCIIFACTIISEERLVVLHNFLNAFKQNFTDTDIYIGINSVSLSGIEDIINSYDLNVIFMDRCPELLYSESDASAYQIALRGLHASSNVYDKYWFIHTKGGVNKHSDYLREWYINNFLGKRTHIEQFITQSDEIGSYGMLGLEFDENRIYGEPDCEIHLFKNTLTDDLPYTHANFFYIHSIYVIDNKPMQIFLNLISDIWFNTKLDRYYFEGVFPFIVSRTGYFPYLENQYSCSYVDLQPYIDKWINDNNLEKFQKYSNIFKTNFTFKQLYPPYVSSNT
jgi:hypothetical protein